MSKKARSHLISRRADCWMAVETHLRKEHTAAEANKHKANYDSTVSFARESTESESGSYGGTWVAARKHLNTSHINGDKTGRLFCTSPETDVCGRNVHFVNGDVMAFAGYARNGEYQKILGHVSRATSNGQAPFFMLLDANVKKEEVQAYLEEIGMAAVVMTPTNGDITCREHD